MSQHKRILKNGHELMYGLDKPTGGYFYTEFDGDDAVEAVTALTLRELEIAVCDKGYIVVPTDVMMLLDDWANADNPTPLQYMVNSMAGIDLAERLLRVAKEVSSYVYVNRKGEVNA